MSIITTKRKNLGLKVFTTLGAKLEGLPIKALNEILGVLDKYGEIAYIQTLIAHEEMFESALQNARKAAATWELRPLEKIDAYAMIASVSGSAKDVNAAWRAWQQHHNTLGNTNPREEARILGNFVKLLLEEEEIQEDRIIDVLESMPNHDPLRAALYARCSRIFEAPSATTQLENALFIAEGFGLTATAMIAYAEIACETDNVELAKKARDLAISFTSPLPLEAIQTFVRLAAWKNNPERRQDFETATRLWWASGIEDDAIRCSLVETAINLGDTQIARGIAARGIPPKGKSCRSALLLVAEATRKKEDLQDAFVARINDGEPGRAETHARLYPIDLGFPLPTHIEVAEETARSLGGVSQVMAYVAIAKTAITLIG